MTFLLIESGTETGSSTRSMARVVFCFKVAHVIR